MLSKIGVVVCMVMRFLMRCLELCSLCIWWVLVYGNLLFYVYGVEVYVVEGVLKVFSFIYRFFFYLFYLMMSYFL